VFIGFEAQSKFWLNFELGSRTGHTANRLLAHLVYLMPWGFEQFLVVTTDKLAAYEKAITRYLKLVQYAYLQIVKQRRKRQLVKVKERIVKGKAEDFPHKTKNTSYIERFNLSLRQRVSYLQAKTLGYCKRPAHFQTVLWINLFDYNYGQSYKSLREEIAPVSGKFQRRYHHLTPAMKMGLTTMPLDWRHLIAAPIPENAHQFSTSTIL
jgi:IS1 family transposase